MPAMDTDAVLDLLKEVAAELITPRFRTLADGEVMEKNPGDLVTVADREAEVAITARLTAAYPGALVLGEEAYAADPLLLQRFSAAAHAFTVDPVDGTKNFVNGSPDHAVMVAELVDGETTRGWIWQPEHKVAWVAERGAGCFVDGQAVHRAPVAGETLPRGASSVWARRGESLGDFPPLTRTWACCGVDYPALLRGETDFLWYSHSHAWDHAPGALMLREAGGEVGHLDGSRYAPRITVPGLIAAADPVTLSAVQRRIAAADLG